MEKQSRSRKPICEKALKDDIEKIKKHVDELDSTYIIRTRKEFDSEFGTMEEHVAKHFGPRGEPWYTPEEKRLMRIMKDKLYRIRKDNLIKRVEYEMQIADNYNEYVIFDTLTVKDEYMKEVFEVKSKQWDSYIKRYKRNCTNHRYFAAVERGEKTGRLHIHVLHIFSTTSFDMSCPNKFRTVIKDNREINSLKFWKYGWSKPIAVRFSPNDRFGKEGHIWPEKLEGKKIVPIEAKPGLALARYVAKYINKGLIEGEWKWRTRMSRNFGNQILKMMMEKISSENLMLVINHSKTIKKMMKKSVTYSHSQMRKQAVKTYLRRMKLVNNGRNLLNVWSRMEYRQTLLDMYRTLIQTKEIPNPENCGILTPSSFVQEDI
jgi:hypothetical protein